MVQWSGLGLQYSSGDTEPCKELKLSVAHQQGAGQLWLTDVCQQDIVVRDSQTNAVLFRQPSHALLSPGSCITFYEMASGKAGFSMVEDNGEQGGRAVRRAGLQGLYGPCVLPAASMPPWPATAEAAGASAHSNQRGTSSCARD